MGWLYQNVWVPNRIAYFSPHVLSFGFILFEFCYFLYFFKFIFRERGKEGEIEGQKHQCVIASHMTPTGDLACNPGMCPDWESNH